MILIDAGPLIGMFDAQDQYHRRAREEINQLVEDDLFLTSASLVEICFALKDGHQRSQLRDFLDLYEVSPILAEADPTFRINVFEWLHKYAEHRPDFADGCLAVLSGMDSRYRVWTYDGEFRTIWRRPDGSKIPLAVPHR